MEQRHIDSLNKKIDILLDSGTVTITEREFARFHGKSRIGKRMKKTLAEMILTRAEAEYDEVSVLVYDESNGGDGYWTFVLNDNLLIDINQWLGKDD